MPDFFVESLDDPLLDAGAKAFTAVNSAVNPSVIDPTTLRAASNMVLEGDGACRRRPGFVRVVAPDLLVFPDYDGNGMFKSLGNVVVNPAVGLLFIDMGEKPRRLRVNGTARVVRDDPLMQRFAGAQLLVRVKARAIFPNCPRYIVTPGAADPSKYAPRPGHEPPEPAWKGFDDFKGYVHPRQKTPDGSD